MNEDGCHLAPYMATSGGIDNIFPLFLYERGNTSPTINQTNPAVIFVAAAPVRNSGNTVDITFNVDMGVQNFNEQFAIGDPVKIAGNFNGWNNGADYLTDVDGDTIYSITKTFDIGDTLIYRFIKRDYDWENDPNKIYTITSEDLDSGYLYILRYFNNFNPPPIKDTTVTIKFTVNMADAISAINS